MTHIYCNAWPKGHYYLYAHESGICVEIIGYFILMKDGSYKEVGDLRKEKR